MLIFLTRSNCISFYLCSSISLTFGIGDSMCFCCCGDGVKLCLYQPLLYDVLSPMAIWFFTPLYIIIFYKVDILSFWQNFLITRKYTKPLVVYVLNRICWFKPLVLHGLLHAFVICGSYPWLGLLLNLFLLKEEGDSCHICGGECWLRVKKSTTIKFHTLITK